VLSISDEKALAVFDKNVLRYMYGAVRERNDCRIRHNYELYAVYEDMDIMTFINVGMLKLVRQVMFEWTSNDQRKEFVTPNQNTEEKEQGLN
jgi:hypothetical protein